MVKQQSIPLPLILHLIVKEAMVWCQQTLVCAKSYSRAFDLLLLCGHCAWLHCLTPCSFNMQVLQPSVQHAARFS